MPPKGSSKKRDAEEAPPANGSDDKKAPAAAGELRRSTRGGGHPAPEPKAAAAPSAAKPRATKKAKTADAADEAGEKAADANANGNGKEEEAAPAGPTEPTKDGVAEGIPTEEKGVTVPEENKEIAKAAEAEATSGDKEASKSKKRLEVGESLPEGLILKNENDEDVSIADIVKEKGAVFFVYPKANTPGCTTQACDYRDQYADFGPLGYDVYGLSGDSPKAQLSWKQSKNLPYHLLCDPGQILLSLLGAVKSAKSNQRSHYVVEKGGKIIDAKYTVSPKDSTRLALEFIKSTKGDTEEKKE